MKKPQQDSGIMTTTVTGTFCTCPPLGTVPRRLHSWWNATSAVFCIWQDVILSVFSFCRSLTSHYHSRQCFCSHLSLVRLPLCWHHIHSLLADSIFSFGSILNLSIKRCSLGFSRHWLLMRFDNCLWSGISNQPKNQFDDGYASHWCGRWSI